MDVWFDSGSSWNGTLKERGYAFPSDLYLEGSDQYRGWFNSSLILSVATQGTAPYKNVVSHGWVLDEHGEQMHKSKGNGVDPVKIANVYGADILRLWVSTVNYQQDVRIGDNLIKQVAEQYRKIRNTLKFISWNIVDFDTKKPATSFEKVDNYILSKLDAVVDEVTKDFDNYDFQNAMNCIMTFMSSDLSAFYLDISKDILYCEAKDSFRRNQVQTVLYRVGETLLRLLNPVLPFTMDEFNRNLPGERKGNAQFLDYPKAQNEASRDETLKEYDLFKSFRDDVLKALENARTAQVIGSSQQAFVTVNLVKEENAIKSIFKDMDPRSIAQLFVVSGIKFVDEAIDAPEYGYARVSVSKHTGHFCERCWNYEDDAVVQEDGTYLCKRCAKVVGK